MRGGGAEPRPHNHTLCRAGPACPAGGAAENRFGSSGRPTPTLHSTIELRRGRRPRRPVRISYQVLRRAGKNPPVTASPCQPPLGKGAINPSDASRPSSYRISQRTCWENIFYQLSFIPNRIDCSFSFQRLSVWMTSSSVSVFGRICKMENWKNLYRSGCAQITSFISLLCPCSEST